MMDTAVFALSRVYIQHSNCRHILHNVNKHSLFLLPEEGEEGGEREEAGEGKTMMREKRRDLPNQRRREKSFHVRVK